LLPTITKILYYVSGFSVVIPLGLGIRFFRQLDFNSRLVMLVLSFSTIAQLLSLYPRLPFVPAVFNTYCISDAIVWGYLFYKNSRNRGIKNAIVIIVSLQVVATIYVFITSGLNTKFYSEFVCLSSLLQVLWVLSYFYERYEREEIHALESKPIFWFCLGILIYAPATYFRFAFFHQISQSDYAVKIIHSLLNTCMYLVFSIGILTNVLKTLKFRNVFIRYRS
jgi:hypothetical protein